MTIRAVWVNGGVPDSWDISFLQSHKINMIAWQFAWILGSNGNSIAYDTNRTATYKAAVQMLKNNGFQVIWWMAGRPEDPVVLDTQAKRVDWFNKIIAFCEEFGFSGIVGNYETSYMTVTGDTNWETVEWSWVQLMNEESAALQSAGLIDFVDRWGGADLWVGNYENKIAPNVNLTASYALVGNWIRDEDVSQLGFSEYSYMYEGSERTGYVPALYQMCRSTPNTKCLVNIGYDTLWIHIKYIQDMIDNPQYGDPGNIEGFILYDYVFGLGEGGQVFPTVDAPIGYFFPQDWTDWDAWALKEDSGVPPTPKLTVQSNPSAIPIKIDGVSYTTPVTKSW